MMHKFRILLELQKGNIDIIAACTQLHTTVRTLGQMMTLWGPRLKHITPVVDKLLETVNTKNDQAVLKSRFAELSGTSYRQVNRVLKASGIEVPPPETSLERLKKHETAQNRRQMREKYALDVIAGLSDAEIAALSAEVTRRHMYRLVGQLLALEGYVFRDMRLMSLETRKELANRLEKGVKDAHV